MIFLRNKKILNLCLKITHSEKLSRRKNSKMFPCGTCFCCVFDEIFLKNFWLCNYTQALFVFQNIPCLAVFWICLSQQLFSNLYSDLMLCTASDTFRILTYSELFSQYVPAYSIIFSIINTYSHILRHY